MLENGTIVSFKQAIGRRPVLTLDGQILEREVIGKTEIYHVMILGTKGTMYSVIKEKQIVKVGRKAKLISNP